MADEITPVPAPTSQPVPRTAPIAIWSLVLAILSFNCGLLFTSIPAVICGHIALSKIRKSGGALRGKGIAIGGLILGYIAVPLGVLATLFMIDMIKSDRERLHQLATERKAIDSDDGKIWVTVTGMWTKMPGLDKQASLQAGDKDEKMFVIVITDAKADVPDLTLEKHHQLTRSRMLQKMKNASATQPVSLTIDGHPALQDELTRKGPSTFSRNVLGFPSYYRGRRRPVSTDPCLDSQIPLAKSKSIAPRNYPKFSQREGERFLTIIAGCDPANAPYLREAC